MRPLLHLGALVSCTALLAGCAAGSSSKSAVRATATYTQQAVTYVRCMRAHGVTNFPNVTGTDHNGEHVTFMDLSHAVVSSPGYNAASQACARILPPPP